MDSSRTSTPSLDRVKMVVYTKSLVQPPVMGALIKQLEAQQGKLEFEILKDSALIRGSVEKTNLTVLILTLHAKEELVEVLNVLTQVESRIQSGLLRAIVLNGMNHPRVMTLLKSKGVSEIVDFQVSIKALNHKIKNALLLVTQTFQRLQNQKVRTSTVLGNDGNGKSSNREVSSNDIVWEKPTEHLNDYWWLPSARNLRCVMGRWLIDILGPGPAVGSWEETTYERHGERGWEWKIRVSTDPTFQPRSGRWIFFGKQPEFVWQKNLWAFVSKMPYLAFYAEGEKDAEFVRFDAPAPGKMRAHENSEVSRAYLPKIQASLEASMKLSKTEEKSDLRGNFEPSSENSSVGGGGFYSSSGDGASSGGPSFQGGSISPDEAPADWNNHTGAVGFGFRAKDIQVGRDGPGPKWRNALTPDEGIGGVLGLGEIQQAGLVAGAKTFERPILELFGTKRNGAPYARRLSLRVMEVTPDRAGFEISSTELKSADRIVLEVEFRLGDVEKKFELEWACEYVEPVDGGRAYAAGIFTGGNLAELGAILRLVEQRHIELQGFFAVARGA
jgi:hypothetical protein